jgi:glycogen synthase
MEIVHVHHHYWPIVGRLENVVRALAEGMAKQGHEVYVMTSTYGAKEKSREEIINGVHMRRAKSMRLSYPDLTYPLEYPMSILKDTDIVQAYSQNSFFTYTIAKRSRRTALVITMSLLITLKC